MPIIATLIVIAAAAAAAWFYLRPVPDTGLDPAGLLPQDTMAVMRMLELEKGIASFKTSRLGRKLKEMDIPRVMQVSGAPEDAVNKYLEIKGAIEETLDSVLFKELFGKDVLLALGPVKNDVLKNPLQALDSVLLIARTKRRAALVEFISAVFAHEMEAREVTKYNDHTITSFQVDQDIHLFYTVSDGLLLAGFNLDALKKSLDLKSNPSPSLRGTPYYQTLSEQLAAPDHTSFFFYNLDKLRANAAALIKAYSASQDAPQNEKDLQQMLKQINNLKGINAVGGISRGGMDTNLQTQIRVLIDKSQLTPVYANAYSYKPVKNPLLAMTPSKTLLCYWANSIDLDTMLNFYLQEAGLTDTDIQGMKDAFQARTGLAFDEVIQSIGNQYGVVLADIHVDGLFPIPELALAVQTQNQEALTQLAAALTQESPMGFKEEAYKDVVIKTWILPLGNMLQPSMAFLDDFCLLSVNRQLLEEMIRLNQNGGGLATTQAFKEVDQGLTEAINSMTYIKSDRLADKLKTLAKWGGDMVMMKDQRAAPKVEVILDELIHPLLNGLKMYQTIGARVVFKEKVVEINSNCQMEKQTSQKDG